MSKNLLSLLFDAAHDRIAQLSQQDPFDVIVIGSGMGGGVVAHSLAVHKHKRVLLIEKGGLIFSTHSLNTTRPRADLSQKSGPAQDNEIIYNKIKDIGKFTEESDNWVGGTVNCLGGRSNLWGLFVPRIDPITLNKYFPADVVRDLADYDDEKMHNYYRRAESLMCNELYPHNTRVEIPPTYSPSPQAKQIFDALKTSLRDLGQQQPDLELQDLQWSLLASQFSTTIPYEFPQGGYSSTDRILDAVFNQESVQVRSRPPNLVVLAETEVTGLVQASGNIIGQVVALDAQGREFKFFGKTVVLAAGSIDSPAILLRSGIKPRPDAPRELYPGLTDHNLYNFRFTIPKGESLPAAKIQLDGEVAVSAQQNAPKIPFLLNISVNAKTFLGRGFSETQDQTPINDDGVCTFVYEFAAALNPKNFVAIDSFSGKPCIHIKNSGEEVDPTTPNGAINEHIKASLTKVNNLIEQVILEQAGESKRKKLSSGQGNPNWNTVGLGVVAHEVGTLPMSKTNDFVVDKHLRFNQFQNLYVCDMSIFPVSPPANPSLTLVALALRLVDHIAGLPTIHGAKH